MSILDYIKYRLSSNNSADTARERLQIIVAHERLQRNNGAVNLQELQKKLIDVISEHLHIDKHQVIVDLQQDKTRSVLELNFTLPDTITAR